MRVKIENNNNIHFQGEQCAQDVTLLCTSMTQKKNCFFASFWWVFSRFLVGFLASFLAFLANFWIIFILYVVDAQMQLRHPLDPLTPDELQDAIHIVKHVKQLSPLVRFMSLGVFHCSFIFSVVANFPHFYLFFMFFFVCVVCIFVRAMGTFKGNCPPL